MNNESDEFKSFAKEAINSIWNVADEADKEDKLLVTVGEAMEKVGVGVPANTLPLFGKMSTIRGICLSRSGYGESHELFVYSEDSDGNLWKMELGTIPDDYLTEAHRKARVYHGCSTHKKIPKNKAAKLLDSFDRNKEFAMIKNAYGVSDPCINYIKSTVVEDDDYEIVEIVVLNLKTFKETITLAHIGYTYIDHRGEKEVQSYIPSADVFLKEELLSKKDYLSYLISEGDEFEIKKTKRHISLLTDDNFIQSISLYGEAK